MYGIKNAREKKISRDDKKKRSTNKFMSGATCTQYLCEMLSVSLCRVCLCAYEHMSRVYGHLCCRC